MWLWRTCPKTAPTGPGTISISATPPGLSASLQALDTGYNRDTTCDPSSWCPQMVCALQPPQGRSRRWTVSDTALVGPGWRLASRHWSAQRACKAAVVPSQCQHVDLGWRNFGRDTSGEEPHREEHLGLRAQLLEAIPRENVFPLWKRPMVDTKLSFVCPSPFTMIPPRLSHRFSFFLPNALLCFVKSEKQTNKLLSNGTLGSCVVNVSSSCYKHWQC